jgi:TonB family protein
MFDKLVESDAAGAEFKNRSRYFMVSTVVVGILFLTAVVYSLYAADIGFVRGDFEIAELISPITPDEPEPEPQRAQPQTNQTAATPRNVDSNVATIEDVRHIPSLDKSGEKASRSFGREKFDPLKPISLGDANPNGGISGSTTGTSASNYEKPENEETEVRLTEPPPVKQTPKAPVSGGVVNGKATYLPVPQYSPAAKAVNAGGIVDVQVTIDETGRVISAKAVNGHPLLKPAAESAARQARFSPTLLSKVPVKVTGVIVYNFKRN